MVFVAGHFVALIEQVNQDIGVTASDCRGKQVIRILNRDACFHHCLNDGQSIEPLLGGRYNPLQVKI